MDKTKANESQIDNLVDNIRISQDNNSEQQTNFYKDPVAPATQDHTPAARSHGNESPKLFQAKRQKRRQPIVREEPQNESEDSKKLKRL